MDQQTYYHLILRYPPLRLVVNRCYLSGSSFEFDHLLDYMFSIELEDRVLCV